MSSQRLANILKNQSEEFQSLAATWLDAGALALDVWSNGHVLARWPAHQANPAAFLANLPTLRAPLRTGDNLIGELRVLGLADPVAQKRLQADAALITQLMRLEDDLDDMTAELIESQDQLVALYALAQSTRSSLDLPQALRSLASVTARLINAQVCIMLVNSSHYLEFISHPVSLLDTETLFALFERVQESESEILLDDESKEPPPTGVYNLCLVPIHIRGAVVAALGLLNKPDKFILPDLQLLRAIAGQAGAQIENVLLHQETLARTRLQTEMELATQAQLHLLPQHPPMVEGLGIYAESRPALQVGGDFYDFIYQMGRPLTFSVGDIAGKGMSAALLMAMARTAIRSKASFMPRATPETVMNRSNDDLYGDFAQVGKYATVFVGQYEPTQRRLIYTNAGHSPVIYCPAAGPARILMANGVAMGLPKRHAYTNQALALNPGDVLIVATDGFSEARNRAGEIFGFDRLLALTETVCHLTPREIAQGWFDAVNAFEAGRPQDDDQTLMVLQVQRSDAS